MLTASEMYRLYGYVADGGDDQAVLTRRLISDVMIEREQIALVTEQLMSDVLLERAKLTPVERRWMEDAEVAHAEANQSVSI